LLTLAGRQFAARVATSILSTAGVPELSTVSIKDYVAKAVHLATHPEDLLALRQKISAARHGSPLFDTKRWTRDYEALLQMCYQRHRAGEAPDHMSLSDG
jgi:predicted O-linked N-acetylglucosamine transferase (SPINDLY family)